MYMVNATTEQEKVKVELLLKKNHKKLSTHCIGHKIETHFKKNLLKVIFDMARLDDSRLSTKK